MHRNGGLGPLPIQRPSLLPTPSTLSFIPLRGISDQFLALATGALQGSTLTWAVIEVEFWFRNGR